MLILLCNLNGIRQDIEKVQLSMTFP